MDVRRNLFTRQQIGEITGVPSSTLNYWMRENVLRAAEGGGGKGLHRRFRYEEVTLSAILERLRRFGVSISDLRQVADLFHNSIDYIENLGLDRISLERVEGLILHRQKIISEGYYPHPIRSEGEFPDHERFPWLGSEHQPCVHLTWDEVVSWLREGYNGHAYTEEAVALAESVDPDEFGWQAYYYRTITHIADRIYEGADPDYFQVGPGGEWRIAPSPRPVTESDSENYADAYIAIDIDLITYRIWHGNVGGQA